MGVYYCFGCDDFKDNDHSPQAESAMCEKCDHKLSEWHITYNPKPIPSRMDDWDYVHKDYDGPEDGRCGTAPSREAAIIYILEMDND